MKIITTSTPLKEFDGTEIKVESKVQTLGSVVSNLLAQDQTNPSRGWVLGKKFATDETVELMAEDVVYIKSVIETLKVNAIYGGQIIELLESVSE